MKKLFLLMFTAGLLTFSSVRLSAEHNLSSTKIFVSLTLRR